MQIGKLYQIKNYFWLLYPSKDIAARSILHVARYGAGEIAALSKRFNCNVSCIDPSSIFFFIEEDLQEDGKYLKVLTTNGELGWIRYPEDKEWAKSIEEVA